MNIEQATARYAAAQSELLEASIALRQAVAENTKAVVRATRVGRRPRRGWVESSAMAVKVRQFKEKHPLMTQQQIALEIGITRALVAHYLSPCCKAAIRVSAPEYAR